MSQLNHAIRPTPSGNVPVCGAVGGRVDIGGVTCPDCRAILDPPRVSLDKSPVPAGACTACGHVPLMGRTVVRHITHGQHEVTSSNVFDADPFAPPDYAARH